MEDNRGYSVGARSLIDKPTGEDKETKKRKVVKDIIKLKTKQYFNPNPVIDDQDTITKN